MAKVGSRTAKEAVAIATKYLGYKEKASNANLDSMTDNAGSNNYTKFAKELHEAGYYNGNKNGYAWCDVFVDYCIWELCDHDKVAAEAMECQTGTLGAGCEFSAQYYKAQNRLYKNPKVGDQIFFTYTDNGPDHTGIVASVSGSKIVTIEGNKSNMVSRCEYSTSDRTIYGYGRPKYDAEPSAANTTAAATVQSAAVAASVTKKDENDGLINICNSGAKARMLMKGMSGNDCRALMVMLHELGYYKAYPDNIFGNMCYNAVVSFQKANGLEVDGVVGSETWGALIGKGGIIKYGSKGLSCRNLMALLKDRGYYDIAIDDVFGPVCQKGVKRYQAAVRIESDGEVGPITWTKLLSK